MTQTSQGNVIDVSELQEELFGPAAPYGEPITNTEAIQVITATDTYTYFVLK
jgi:hypothetical protein